MLLYSSYAIKKSHPSGWLRCFDFFALQVITVG